MKRRDFLKKTFSVVAGVSVLPSVVKAKTEEVKCGDRGCCIKCEKKDSCLMYKQDQVILNAFIPVQYRIT
jgi:hypothetical protein